MKTTASLLAYLAAFAVQAADLPELVLPHGVGVNIHFTRGHERLTSLGHGVRFCLPLARSPR